MCSCEHVYVFALCMHLWVNIYGLPFATDYVEDVTTILIFCQYVDCWVYGAIFVVFMCRKLFEFNRTYKYRLGLHVHASSNFVYEWINEWMNEWMNERTIEWMNEWTNERTNEWMNEWMNTYECICRWMHNELGEEDLFLKQSVWQELIYVSEMHPNGMIWGDQLSMINFKKADYLYFLYLICLAVDRWRVCWCRWS